MVLNEGNNKAFQEKWCGRKKAVTFSFDDGVTQDIRLIEILNRYGLKGTFNINSELLGKQGQLIRNGKEVRHDKISPCDLRSIYEGHEVAVHTLTHPNLTTLNEEEIVRQVEEDRKQLSRLCGYEVVGMAYPCGGVNNDERVADIIQKNTGVKYARTITSTYSFDEQEKLLRFNPTVYYVEEKLEAIIEAFLALESEEPQLLYIWGHSYEMDAEYITWEKFESLCARLANRSEIFYGTNREVFGI
ncbi:MAG: polysaccharide deacetylase family protein [Clostridia bacterium]|nr:polysaccharide deacetylase family protein [Clostridia bacterium]